MWWNEYIAAWSGRDGRTIASFMAPDAVYQDVALGERKQGCEEIAAWIDGMKTSLSSDFTFRSTSFIQEGNRYAGEWTMSGTHDGSSPQMPASGRRFSIQGASIGVLQDGKIKTNTDYWNFASFLIQVGAMAAPEAE